jgi:hypothetical protein
VDSDVMTFNGQQQAQKSIIKQNIASNDAIAAKQALPFWS